jgi:hypothetical protein
MHGMKFGKCVKCNMWVKWISYFDCKKAQWEYHYFDGCKLIDNKPYCKACKEKK